MERKELICLKNNGNKLCKQLLSLVDFSKGNNYENTHIEVDVYKDFIVVSTFYGGDPGDIWYNENDTRVNKPNIPFFAMKKLGML